jgi:hypothetical protein
VSTKLYVKGWVETMGLPVRLTYKEATRDQIMDSLGIPDDRRYPWHVVTIKSDGWHMAHPITCELASCSFDAVASDWNKAPDELGTYAWDDNGWRPLQEHKETT